MLKRAWATVAVVGMMAGGSAIARADDVNDARKVVETFLTAVQAGDAKAAHAAVSMTPEMAGAVNGYLDLMVATASLQKAAAAKFGSSAAATFGKSAGEEFDARLKAVKAADGKVAGSSVLLTIPADPAAKQQAMTLVLVKSGTSWKIDGASLFDLSPEDKGETDKRVALSGKLRAITEQMIKEINAGKYAAAVDAYQEFWTRSVKAAKEVRASEGAATQASQN